MKTDNEIDSRSFMDYVKNGDPFFREGLTFDEYISQRDSMLNTMQSNAQLKPRSTSNNTFSYNGLRVRDE